MSGAKKEGIITVPFAGGMIQMQHPFPEKGNKKTLLKTKEEIILQTAIGIILLITYVAFAVYAAKGGNLMLGFFVMAVLWALPPGTLTLNSLQPA